MFELEKALESRLNYLLPNSLLFLIFAALFFQQAFLNELFWNFLLTLDKKRINYQKLIFRTSFKLEENPFSSSSFHLRHLKQSFQREAFNKKPNNLKCLERIQILNNQ
ncbi:hypothetical protein BpHYR1_043177 [Brachionus plicatilis]|uniref:Uncharacterized protein n=1 Tax=Brachionus plicatilis TaxID=10195 RepID=A0A3M7R9L1_BRAPC|nr:hypothetical protein BpHYR1_043177 [Brachionus plicatilis]